MSDVPELLDRHRAFQADFDSGGLPIPPHLSTIILTCVDARVDPAHLFSLRLGDALVLRNTGARVTPGVLEDLAALGVLSSNWPGDRALELVMITHTGCGMAKLAEPATQQEVAERLGVGLDEVATKAVVDPAVTVTDNLERLRNAPSVLDNLVVSGFVYDVVDGSLTEITPTGPLRSRD